MKKASVELLHWILNLIMTFVLPVRCANQLSYYLKDLVFKSLKFSLRLNRNFFNSVHHYEDHFFI